MGHQYGGQTAKTSGLHVSSLVRQYQSLKLRLIQFPQGPKYLEKSQICDLFSSSHFQNKRVSSCHSAALFTKINEEMTKLFCFSP